MSAWLIAAVTLAYLWVCYDQWSTGHYDMAIVYFGYSVANVGLIMNTVGIK